VGLRDEILEQPDVARRLLESGDERVAPVADAIRSRDVEFAVIAARGSSDHAALYAQYVLGVRNRLPVALAAPSILSLYGVTPRFERSVVLGISQSGASPDVVGVLEAARAQGAVTVAITNEPQSALAGAAEHVIDLRAGAERSIAATKTYTAELIVLAQLSAALLPDEHVQTELGILPDAISRAAALEEDAAAIARDQAAVTRKQGEMSRCVVLGRGFNYATAREWALKLKEVAGVLADPYSAADFQHGPLSLIEPGFAVLAVATSGPAAADMAAMLQRLRDEHGAELLVISDVPELRRGATYSLALPDGVAEWLSPIVSIVPAQLHAYHVALARKRDPEAPRHLRKVTLTR
jgi:glucosamine--fructose-6-phosphate aminotransferase (isomerizing)